VSASLAESLIDRIVLQRDLLQSMSEHCKAISARVTSRDKTVSVEVDGIGTMTGLWLGPNAYRNGPDALATLIVETAQAAAQVAVERQNFLLKEFQAKMAELQGAPLRRYDGTVVQPLVPDDRIVVDESKR
jgi:DNA-binding protein YbaB